MLKDIFLNGVGPFRMLLDTGNATSIVRPEVARRLNLKPAYLVEQATVAETRRVPAAVLDEVRAGSVVDRSVEAIIGDVFQAGADGILGANWLVRHDYLLDYRARRVTLDGLPTVSGVRLPLLSIDGRPEVVALIDGCPRELVVDSGASEVVLYEKPLNAGTVVQLDSNRGSVRAKASRGRFLFPGDREHIIDVIRVDAGGLGSGLLPTRAFESVFVSNREGFVEFTR
jgi:hypothetical protein